MALGARSKSLAPKSPRSPGFEDKSESISLGDCLMDSHIYIYTIHIYLVHIDMYSDIYSVYIYIFKFMYRL